MLTKSQEVKLIVIRPRPGWGTEPTGVFSHRLLLLRVEIGLR